MSNTIPSTYMSLPVPIVGVDIGPQYAFDTNSCLTIIDQHTHQPGSGQQITPSGLNINSDLSFASNNAINLRTSRYVSQSGALTNPSDIGCVYVISGNLYYNNLSGTAVQITSGNAISGAAGTISGLPSGTAGVAYATSGTTTNAFIFTQATATAANLDAATLIIRYPGSYPTITGNYIALEAPSSLATGFAYTFPATLPAANNTFMTVSTAGVISTSITVDNSTLNIASSTIAIKSQGVTQGLLALRANGTSVAAGGVAVSTSCGSYTTTSTSPVQVTNLSCTLVTTGRPVYIFLHSDGGLNNSAIGALNSSGSPQAVFTIKRGSSVVGAYSLVSVGSSPTEFLVPSSSFHFMDFPSAGTYTYNFFVNAQAGGNTAIVNYSLLVAYEI